MGNVIPRQKCRFCRLPACQGTEWRQTMLVLLSTTALTEAFTVGNEHLGEWISFHA